MKKFTIVLTTLVATVLLFSCKTQNSSYSTITNEVDKTTSTLSISDVNKSVSTTSSVVKKSSELPRTINNSDTEIILDTNLASNIIYVNDDANGNNDGTSWTNAFNDLQDAIAISTEGDQIWVASGIYYASDSDASDSFSLVDGTDLFGGFAGNETSIDQRDLTDSENISTLSGDFNNTPNDASDNTNNILIATNGIIDGFNIIDGYSARKIMPMQSNQTANSNSSNSKMGPPPMKGSSSKKMGPPPMRSNNSQVSRDNNLSATNQTNPNSDSVGHSSPDQVKSGDAESTTNGAGIVVWGVSAVIKNTTISNCYADKGGAVYVNVTGDLDAQPIFYNVIFENNSAQMRGGAISIDMFSDPIFVDCKFINNSCGSKGGAIYDDFGCSPRLYNCLFVGNDCEVAAAMGNDGASNPTIVNSTFTENNSTEQGAALYQGTGPFNDPVVYNSIISGNTSTNGQASVYNYNESNTAIYDSIVEGGYTGLSSNIIDTVATFDAEYNSTNSSYGYNSNDFGTRTDDELKQIISYLLSIESTSEPTPLSLTNNSKAIASSSTIYVSQDGIGDGSSKSNSMSDLQEAIYMANNYYVQYGKNVTINIANGTYTPGIERSSSFTLLDGVDLVGESESLTILSGEIQNDGDPTNNSYHVVIGSDNASLTNLSIRDGYADGKNGEVYDKLGAGLLNYAAGNRVIPTYEPTLGFDTKITNVTFTNNYAECGAAVYTYHGGNPVFTDCSFTNNIALYGGASYDVGGCASKYYNCDFSDNIAKYAGGAIFVDYGALSSYYNCDFTNNEAGTCGGVLYIIDRASQSILNDTDFSVLIDTTADSTGDTDIYSSAYFKNCTISGNKSANGDYDLYAVEGSYIKLVDTAVSSDNYYISFQSHLID